MNHFHFLRPLWFVLLPLLAVLLWRYHRRKAQSRSWQAVCDPELLPHLLIGNSEGQKSAAPLFLMAFSGSMALFALAGPVWEQLEQPVFRDQSALVLVLDLSRSMDATDITPSRLTRARHKIIDILKKREEGQTALVVYAADAFVVSPLTQDAETIISQVSALKTPMMPEQGSRPDIALKKAGQLLQQAGVPRGRVLMITDGLENVPKEKMAAAVKHLQKERHILSVLGVGSAEGAPIKLSRGGFLKDREGRIVIPQLDEAALRRIAQEGGGGYQALAVDDSDIDSLMVASLPSRFEDQSEETGLKTDRWQEEGPWLLLPLLPFAALAFRRGILAVILLICLSLPHPAQAFEWPVGASEWNELWSRPDQRAEAAFSQGDEAGAAAIFENPEWKSASHYRAGQFQESIDALEGIQSPDAFYNKGNALAEMGRFPEAITAYDEALKLDPKHEDASYNREELQKLVDQQEQQDQNNQQEGGPPEENDGEESDETGQSPDQEPSQDQSGEKSDQAQGDEMSDEEKAQEAENKGDSPQNQEENQDTQEAEKQDQDKSDPEEGDRMAQADLTEQDESQQANEQWLRRIPDDPGGLLRRKFLFQSNQRKTQSSEEHAW